MSKQINPIEHPRTLGDLLRLYDQNTAKFVLEGVVGSGVRWDYSVSRAGAHFDCYWFDEKEMLVSSLCFALNKEDPLAYTSDGFLADPAQWDCADSLRPGFLRLLSTVNPGLTRDLSDKLAMKSVLGRPLYDRENSQAVFRLTTAAESTHMLLRVSLKNSQDPKKYQLFNPMESALGELAVAGKVFYIVRPLGTGGKPRLFCIIEKTQLDPFLQEK